MYTFILFFLGGIYNNICDTLASPALFGKSHYSNSKDFNPNFWDFEISWKGKYKNGDPTQGPKFFGSTTFLVFLTDAWHLYKAAWMLCVALAIVVFYVWPPLPNLTPFPWVYFLWVPTASLISWGAGWQLWALITKK